MIVGQIGSGVTIEDLLADHPYLEREDVLQALRYAAWLAEEREIELRNGMRFIVDMNLSPRWAARRRDGCRALVGSRRGNGCDVVIMRTARKRDAVVRTNERTLAPWRASSGAAGPSVVQLFAVAICGLRYWRCC